MKRIIITLTFSILIAVYPASILALNSDDVSSQKQRRWAFAAYFGSASSGPASDLEDAMIAVDFDHRHIYYLGGGGPYYGATYPSSHTNTTFYRLPWMFKIHYSIKPAFGVGLVFSHTEIGETAGYNEAIGRLNIKYSVMTYSPIVSVQAIGIQFGVGPALYIANSFGELIRLGIHPEAKNNRKNNRKFGFLLDFSIAFPPEKTRFFVEFKAQFRAVGQVKVGPYKTEANNSFSIFPATKVNYNHWFLGGGIGLRF